MSPKVRRTPPYKFRLLCKRCNSYRRSHIEQTRPLVEREGAISGLRFVCLCGNEAESLDEETRDL